MKVTVNPSTDASGFGYAEAGPQRLRVVNAEIKEGPSAPYINWECELADPNVKSTEGKQVGHVFEITTLKPDNNAQFRLRQMVEALGLTWNDFDTEETKGLEFDCHLGVEEYQGQKKNVIKKYVPVKK